MCKINDWPLLIELTINLLTVLLAVITALYIYQSNKVDLIEKGKKYSGVSAWMYKCGKTILCAQILIIMADIFFCCSDGVLPKEIRRCLYLGINLAVLATDIAFFYVLADPKYITTLKKNIEKRQNDNKNKSKSK